MAIQQNGIITTDFGLNDFAQAIAIQADGGILIAGKSYNGNNYDFGVVRYKSNGVLDTSFGTNGKLTTAIGLSGDYASSMILQTDGRILVAGSSNINGISNFSLVRYKVDGSLDSTFGNSGKITTDVFGHSSAYSVTLQTDGKIIAAGTGFSTSAFTDSIALVRYIINGSLDNSFDGDGKVITTTASTFNEGNSVTTQPDGKILVAGTFGIESSTDDDFALLRYDIYGALDSSFGNGGIVKTPIGISSNERAFSVAMQTDGRILVAGYSGSDVALVRYNVNGSLDNSFDGDGKVTTDLGANDSATSIAVQTNGKILVAGTSSNGSNDSVVLMRYNFDGSLDTSFDGDGKVTIAEGFSSRETIVRVSIQSNGQILLAGSMFNGSNSDFLLARYNIDGSLDTTFGTNTPPPSGDTSFNIEFRFDNTVTQAIQAYFETAALRWESIITSDIPDYNGVDDVVIDVSTPYIDGVSKILGQAGPKSLRPVTDLPITGGMKFDSADVANMISKGNFDDVILHEMGHVLGIGTLWDLLGLKSGFSYTGSHALDAYRSLLGNSTVTSIPLETGGGPGTAGSHWAESVFGNEIMTGYADAVMPISKMTLGALQDLGYTVDYTKADIYTLAGNFVDSTSSLISGSLVTDTPTTSNDTLLGTTNNDSISGLAGNDVIYGLEGNDILNGATGFDSIIGGLGKDLLIGGVGKDNLTGGTGADKFKFAAVTETGITATTRDTITDFKHAQGDKIDLSAIDANTALAGNQAFSFIGTAAFSTNATGQLRFDALNHLVYGSNDADTAAEFSILLTGVTSLTASDFIL